MVRELLLSDNLRRRGLFNQAFVERLLNQHDAGRPLDQQLWTLMSFEMWARTFLDRKGVGERTAVPAALMASSHAASRRSSGAKTFAARVSLRERAS